MSNLIPIVGLPHSILEFIDKNPLIKDQLLADNILQQKSRDAKEAQERQTLSLASIFSAINKLSINLVLKNSFITQLRSLVFVETMKFQMMNQQLKRRRIAQAGEQEDEEYEDDLQAEEEAKLKQQKQQQEAESKQREMLLEQAYTIGTYFGNVNAMLALNLKGVKNFSLFREDDFTKLRKLILDAPDSARKNYKFFENMSKEISSVIGNAFERARKEFDELKKYGRLTEKDLNNNKSVLTSCFNLITNDIKKLLSNDFDKSQLDLMQARFQGGLTAATAALASPKAGAVARTAALSPTTAALGTAIDLALGSSSTRPDPNTTKKHKPKPWDVPKGAPKLKPPTDTV